MQADTSLSSRFAVFTTAALRYVRSSYALVAVVIGIGATLAIFAPDQGARWIGCGVVLFGAGAVLWRYHNKGPEAERTPPALTLGHDELKIEGFDTSFNPKFAAELGQLIQKFRKPLPAPAGIVQGLAASGVVRPITAAELKALETQRIIAPVESSCG